MVRDLPGERAGGDRHEAVRKAFAKDDVAYLKGDWTRRTGNHRVPRENGRDGVPLYVFFPPRGQPEVLPQILTENTVLGELNRGVSTLMKWF